MFGLGASEMAVIGIVALIVVGPKDLPKLFRSAGEFTGKARRMAQEFSRAMNAAADESGVNEISKTLQSAANPQKFGANKVREAAMSTIKPGSETAKLSAERQAAKDRMTEAAAKAATERKAKEGAAEATSAPATKSKASTTPKTGQTAKTAAKPKPKATKPKGTAKPKTAAKRKAASKPKTTAKAKKSDPA